MRAPLLSPRPGVAKRSPPDRRRCCSPEAVGRNTFHTEITRAFGLFSGRENSVISQTRSWHGALRGMPGTEPLQCFAGVTARRPKRPGHSAGPASPCLTAGDSASFPSPELRRSTSRAPRATPQQSGTRFSAPEPRRGRGRRCPAPRSRQPSPGCPGPVSADTTRRTAGTGAPLPAAVPPRGGGSGRLRPHLWLGGGGRRSAQTGRRPAAS